MLKKIEEIIQPILTQNDVYLDDIEYVLEKKEWYLRIYIEKNNGHLDMDTCVAVSEAISEKMDEVDIIKNEYYLEVSSPGAEMELRNKEEVSENVGKYIHINTGDTVYEGTFLSFEDDIVVIRVNLKGRFKNFQIPYDSIKKIRLAVKF